MIPQTEDRPLVTFALFAYNQEEYIREAIEGAFSQTYEPLEIILSDDCSSDQTYEIMKEMAACYRGSAQLILRRSEINFGTAMHVEAISRASSGVLFVVAAGDDISKPNRVSSLVSAWQRAGNPRAVIHSGMTVATRLDRFGQESILVAMDGSNGSSPAWPPTCAYTADLLHDFPPLFGGSLIEDGVLFNRARLTGKFIAVDEQLVIQRVVEQSAGRITTFSDTIRWNRHLKSKIICALNVIQDNRYAREVDLPKRVKSDRIRMRAIKRAARLFRSESPSETAISWLFFSFRLLMAIGTLGGLKGRLAIIVKSYPSQK